MEGTGGARGTARVFTGRAASSAKAVGRGKPGSDAALGVASGKRSATGKTRRKGEGNGAPVVQIPEPLDSLLP